MSIAIDEAEEWAQSRYVGSSHIEHHDGRAVSVPNFPQKTNLRREGYIAGRTAEPTDTEIEAAARRLYEITHEEEKRWYEMSEAYRNTYREWAEPILATARKVVTE